MDSKQRGRDEEEGKLDGLGHAAQDSSDGDRDQKGKELLAIGLLRRDIERCGDAGHTEDLGPTRRSDGGPRCELLEGGSRGSELGQGLGPLRVDTPIDGHVVVVERGIEQVVKAEGDEQPLEEDEDRDPPGARTHDDALEHMHADLHLGPQQHRDDGAGEHGKEGDHVNEGGTREHAQPLRKLGVKVLVV